MRNLVLLLLFANVLYFLWNRWVGDVPVVDDGIDIVNPDRLAPRAVLTSEVPPETVEEPPAPACVTFGQFDDRAAAEARQAELAESGATASVRAAPGQVFAGHWVQIVNIDERGDANALVNRLKDGGVEEAYIAGDDAEGYTISLGLFSELERAERVELQAKSLGIEAVIDDRLRDAEVYWVDVTGPDETLAEAGTPCP